MEHVAHVAQVGSARVAYTVAGSGPGLVLVHGTGGSGAIDWGPLLDRFTDAWTVVCPDYAGSGETVDDGGELTLAGLADQVAGAARAAGLESFDLVGFSLGAAVAAQLAADRPELVRGLVLLGGLVNAVDDARCQIQFALWERLCDADPDLFARLALLTVLSPSFVRALTLEEAEEAVAFGVRNRQPGTARQAALDRRIDLRSSLGLIRARTLVVGQTLDAVTPVEHARELHAGIDGAQYAEIPTGHLGLLEQPDVVARTIRDFLLAGRAGDDPR
jgi:pimeloyl-ACP methyl ester carboxylesterase